MPHSNTHTTTAEAVACLMWGPKTYAELMEFTGVGKWTIGKTGAALRQSGVVRVVRRPKGGYTVHLQTTPFALPDEGAKPVTSKAPYHIGRPRRPETPNYGGQPRDEDGSAPRPAGGRSTPGCPGLAPAGGPVPGL